MDTVYVVDADSAIRDALTTLLESYDLSVKAYSDSNSFLQAVRGVPKGCLLIVEAELPGLNGLGLLRELRSKGSTIPVVLLASNAKPDFTKRAERAGAAGVLEKPFVGDELMNKLQAFVGHDTWARFVLRHASEESLSDGTRITIRPIRPSDRQIEQAFVRSLSPMSKHYRFFSGIAELSDKMLDRFTHMHYPDNVAIIATVNRQRYRGRDWCCPLREDRRSDGGVRGRRGRCLARSRCCYALAAKANDDCKAGGRF